MQTNPAVEQSDH